MSTAVPNIWCNLPLLGTALVAAVEDIDRPTVGLLNIGEELIKGNEVVKQAAELLRASPLNFAGNVEGNDIFSGKTDVIVCDGFVGNVALKTSEGLAVMLADFVREEFTRGPLSRLQAMAALPVLRRFKRRSIIADITAPACSACVDSSSRVTARLMLLRLRAH